MSKDTYIGEYLKKGSTLTSKSGDIILYIGTRQKTTLHKPALFLLDKTSAGGKYISSLYQTGLNRYRFEHLGKLYELEFVEEIAVVSMSQKQNAYV